MSDRYFPLCQINRAEKMQELMHNLRIQIPLAADSFVVNDSSLLLKFGILAGPERKSN